MFRQKMKSIFRSFNLSKKTLNVAKPHISSSFSKRENENSTIKKTPLPQRAEGVFYDLLMKFCFIALLLMLEYSIN